MPSGPQPSTTTVSPPRIASSSPCVTAIGSVSTATSSGTSSGTRKSVDPGSRCIRSAQPPQRPGGRDSVSELP